jgi:streptogramin lyase
MDRRGKMAHTGLIESPRPLADAQQQSGLTGRRRQAVITTITGEIEMRKEHLLVSTAVGLAVALLAGSGAVRAEGLSGQVASPKGALDGVLVTAKKAGSTIAYTVATDDKGRYSFPSAKIEPGDYTLTIRAAGYDLDGPGKATVASGKDATADLKLKATKNLPSQLTNAEWMSSMPGTEDQKAFLLNCVGCHTLERVVRSTHDVNEWMQVIYRMMNYAQVSQPIKPQKRMDPEWAPKPETFRKSAEFLASINLSDASKWEYPLKVFDRPTGKMLITEYDLPRPTIEPHDVILDSKGQVWYTNFGELYLGKLDQKTGATSEIPLKEFKPGFPVGTLDIGIDKGGQFWIGMMFQGAIAKFDPKTEQLTYYPMPKDKDNNVTQLNMLGLEHQVDGKIWTNNAGNQEIYRIDLASGKYETWAPMKQIATPGNHTVYGIASDSKNNLWFMEFQDNYIGRIDAKTGALSLFRAPTERARNRRGIMDEQDRLWFAEYRGNKIGMFDTNEQTFKEWSLPTPWTGPYYPVVDRNGEIWTGGMTTDRVVRLDPKTNKTVEYMLPKDTNIRRVFVDNTTNPVTFWTGSNHGASIVKLEPLD